MNVFPDATFVIPHRDPVSVTASFCTMATYGHWQSRDPVDPADIGSYWADRIERMLTAGVRDRDLLPADQSIDVRFDEFMADDVAMVERIYAAGRPALHARQRERRWTPSWSSTPAANTAG